MIQIIIDIERSYIYNDRQDYLSLNNGPESSSLLSYCLDEQDADDDGAKEYYKVDNRLYQVC